MPATSLRRVRADLFEEVSLVVKGGTTAGGSGRTHCFDLFNIQTPPVACGPSAAREPLIGPIIEGGHARDVIVGGRATTARRSGVTGRAPSATSAGPATSSCSPRRPAGWNASAV